MASGVIVLGFNHELESSEFSRELGKLEDKLLRSNFLGYSRVGAVENCDDNDQSNCVGKGELRVAALSVSSSNLISIAESGRMSRDWHGYLGMEKSSIGGKQYLDYL